MVDTELSGEELVLRGDHVRITVAWELRAETVAWLRRFPRADAVGQDDEVGCRIEKLSWPEQLSRERGRKKSSATPCGSMEDQDGIADHTCRILSRLPKRRVVDAELRQHGAVREFKVAEDEIILVSRCRPARARLGGYR